ncbi:MAG: DUF2723 domain-containing protein [Chloroflexota bacterium]
MPRLRTLPSLLFILHLLILLITVAPTIHGYHLDSAEFVIGAHTQGIVHSPGYPLYLMIAKGFTFLPVGNIAFRVNLLSALALAGTTPFLYLALHNLTKDRAFAAGATLVTVFSFHVWQMGVSAEVYAPQLFTLAVTGWLLTRGERTPLHWLALSYGLAAAMNPASVLLAPGVAVVALWWRRSVWAYVHGAAIGAIAVQLPLVYFPVNYHENTLYNAAGYYDGTGMFISLPLDSVRGVWWMLRGVQFNALYFYDGVVPSWAQMQDIFFVMGSNTYWLGAIVAVVGLVAMANTARRQLGAWLLLFIPFIYFYTTYGAIDRTTMIGPAHALLALPMAHGLAALLGDVPERVKTGIVSVAVLLMLAVNLPGFIAQRTDDSYTTAARTINAMPPDAIVFGPWQRVVNMQYIQLVEGQRSDLTLYNLFLFMDSTFEAYITETTPALDVPIVFLEPSGNTPAQNALVAEAVQFTPLVADGVVVGYVATF